MPGFLASLTESFSSLKLVFDSYRSDFPVAMHAYRALTASPRVSSSRSDRNTNLATQPFLNGARAAFAHPYSLHFLTASEGSYSMQLRCVSEADDNYHGPEQLETCHLCVA